MKLRECQGSSTMIGVLVCCCLFGCLCAGTILAAAAGDGLVLYEDFKAKYINPSKWKGYEWNPNMSECECAREVNGGRLRLLVRNHGATTSDEGLVAAENFLMFTDQMAVDTIKAGVTVKTYEQSGCPANPESDQASIRARLRGRFFNSSVSPVDGTNDILAQIRLIRRLGYTEKPRVLRVEASVFHCADHQCMDGTTLGLQTLGTVNVGQKADLRITWDKDGQQFLFQMNKGSEIALPYDPALDVSPPVMRNKALDVISYAPNCQSGPRGVGFVEAFFDNVYTNALE